MKSPPGASLPSISAESLGTELARLCDAEILRIEALGATAPARCASCTFRLGSTNNGGKEALLEALNSLLTVDALLCSKRLGRCAGWELLSLNTHVTETEIWRPATPPLKIVRPVVNHNSMPELLPSKGGNLAEVTRNPTEIGRSTLPLENS